MTDVLSNLNPLSMREVPNLQRLTALSQRHPSVDPVVVETYLHVLHAGNLLGRLEHRVLQQFGLGHGRFCLLALCEEVGSEGHSPAHLAMECEVSRATITGLVDGLERDGFVERVPDAVDRRTVRVRLTESGQHVLGEVFPAVMEQISAAFEDLKSEDFRRLVQLLESTHSRCGRILGESDAVHETANV